MTRRWCGLSLILAAGLVLADSPLLPGSSAENSLEQTILVTVDGSISGLTGSGLLLIDTVSGQTVSITADDREFAFLLEKDSAYNIEIQLPPTEPAQDCEVASPSGIVNDRDSYDIEITCTLFDEIFRQRFEEPPSPLINQF